MENHKIDRLFEDKLSRHEIDPSPAAWEAVHAQISKTKRPVMIWYRVAAAVAAVAVVAVLVLRKDTPAITASPLANAHADHPKQAEPFVWDIPAPANQKETEATPSPPANTQQRVPMTIDAHIQQNETVAHQSATATELLEVLELNTELDAMAQVNTADAAEESILAPPGVSVQITYKATPPVVTEEKSKIEKLWAKAKEIRPGEVLGNIRDTKNDFFNGKKN